MGANAYCLNRFVFFVASSYRTPTCSPAYTSVISVSKLVNLPRLQWYHRHKCLNKDIQHNNKNLFVNRKMKRGELLKTSFALNHVSVSP